MTNLPAPADELLGFVPFVPRNAITKIDMVALIFCGRYIRLSQMAIEALGKPEHVVVFIDRNTRRLMITPGTDQDENALKLAPMPRAENATMIYSDSLRKDIMRMLGLRDLKGYVCHGHSAGTVCPAVIFRLDDMESRAA